MLLAKYDWISMLAVASVALCSLSTACTSSDEPSTRLAGYEAGSGSGGQVAVAPTDGGKKEAGKSSGGLKLTWQVAGLAPLGPSVRSATGDAGAGDAGYGVMRRDYSTGPIEGLKVCVFGDESVPCALTDAAGKFTLSGLPAKADVTLSFQKAGYFSLLLPIETGSTDMDGSIAGPFPVPSNASPASSTPVALDLARKGMIVGFAIAPSATASGFAGALGTKLSLIPMSGDGPYFVNGGNALDLSATGIIEQIGLYLNVDPGTYEVGFRNPGYDCAPLSVPFGYGFAAGPSSVKIPVVAGYETVCGVLCTPSSVIVDTAN